MTKFLIKWEGQRSVQPPAAPISLRMNAQAMIITHEAAQDLQGPQLYLVTCSLPPSLTSFKAPSSLGRPSGLPLGGLCSGCPLHQDLDFSTSSPLPPSDVASRMLPMSSGSWSHLVLAPDSSLPAAGLISIWRTTDSAYSFCRLCDPPVLTSLPFPWHPDQCLVNSVRSIDTCAVTESL